MVKDRMPAVCGLEGLVSDADTKGVRATENYSHKPSRTADPRYDRRHRHELECQPCDAPQHPVDIAEHRGMIVDCVVCAVPYGLQLQTVLI